MPTYNQQDYLPAAIDSVLRQTYPDFELIIVNDGSTDNTAQVMEEYAARDKRIRISRNPVHPFRFATSDRTGK
jgi:glycosyltransferase involved in cell wall biosynthesis